MANKITTLYEDSAKTTALYPRTKTSAVSDNDGNTLGEVAVYHAQDLASGVKGVDLHLDMDLLWTNASPTSSFAAQTISLDLSNYTSVMIVTKDHTSTSISTVGLSEFILLKGIKGKLTDVGGQMNWRCAIPTNSGVSFEAGYTCGSYNNSTSSDNNRVLPIYIYGIK